MRRKSVGPFVSCRRRLYSLLSEGQILRLNQFVCPIAKLDEEAKGLTRTVQQNYSTDTARVSPAQNLYRVIHTERQGIGSASGEEVCIVIRSDHRSVRRRLYNLVRIGALALHGRKGCAVGAEGYSRTGSQASTPSREPSRARLPTEVSPPLAGEDPGGPVDGRLPPRRRAHRRLRPAQRLGWREVALPQAAVEVLHERGRARVGHAPQAHQQAAHARRREGGLEAEDAQPRHLRPPPRRARREHDEPGPGEVQPHQLL